MFIWVYARVVRRCLRHDLFGLTPWRLFEYTMALIDTQELIISNRISSTFLLSLCSYKLKKYEEIDILRVTPSETYI
jgi:hypothetical protein